MEDELKEVRWNLDDPSGEVAQLRDQVAEQAQELVQLRSRNSELLVLVEGLADLEETVDLIPLMADSILSLSRK
jgi:cell division protein FtsB